MSRIIFETARLLLREFSPENDAAGFFELNNDPEVLRYTGDAPFDNEEAARLFLENYHQYRLHGYGRWSTILKETGEFLGWCGLRFMDDLGDADVGFRLHRRHWGQGYATEAARASVLYGFKELQLPAIVGRAAKENTASIRVLEKIGLQYWCDTDLDGVPAVLYRAEAATFS